MSEYGVLKHKADPLIVYFLGRAGALIKIRGEFFLVSKCFYNKEVDYLWQMFYDEIDFCLLK